jgi:hypothetical protein
VPGTAVPARCSRAEFDAAFPGLLDAIVAADRDRP